MPLFRVTMTGADDSTDLSKMFRITNDFPFVEWGILVGSSTGDRFPSRDWIDKLVDVAVGYKQRVHLSLHICGRFLREIASGDPTLLDYLGWRVGAFDRVQLNWHGEKQSLGVAENVLRSFGKMSGCGIWEPEIIFQFDGVNDGLYFPAARRFAVSGLFDRSHGAGVVPGEWPRNRYEIGCGWAGGLGPDNLDTELRRINAVASPMMRYWIDMETKVRTRDGFDLDAVQKCLEIAKPFVVAA